MPDNYLARYLPLLIQFLLVAAIAGGMVTLSWLIGQHKPSAAKLMPYECGMAPVGDARQRFSVKFYLVAMVFILFDVEAIFLYPWAVIFRELKMFGFWEMLVYVLVVLGGFVYVWKKGVFDWSQADRDQIVALPDRAPAGSR
ncbi:MAG: NADH-quinone oxidoreductase subunit A [Acidobacteriota bacterium]|nr:NADH-quinone oxidoreductase subunit A [Acidobacteriota bacterium]